MGFGSFFGAIKNGLGSAVDWVNRNSGTIADVAGIVAQVAGAIILPDDFDDMDSNDDVIQLQRNYNKATQYLEQQADQKIKSLLKSRGSDPATQQTTTTTTAAKLTGVWTAPSFNNAAGQPQVNITQDISKFLEQECLPYFVTTNTGNVNQLAELIAAAAFANENTSLDLVDERGVTTSSISITDDGFSLTGAHSFYKLPMGQSEDDYALHSCISLQCTTTQEFRRRQAAYRKAIHVHAPQVTKASGSIGWLTTVQITWTSIDFALKVWPGVQTILTTPRNSNPVYNVLYSTTTGNLQTLKIQAPKGVTPARTKGDLTDAISQAIYTATYPILGGGEPSNTFMQLPQIDVSGTSILLSSSIMAQKSNVQRGGMQNGAHNAVQSGMHTGFHNNIQEEFNNPRTGRATNVPDGVNRAATNVQGAQRY